MVNKAGAFIGGLVGAVLGFSANAMEYRASGYNHLIPNLSGMQPARSYQKDVTDKIEGKETLVERFDHPNGLRTYRLSIKDKVYAYSKETSKNDGFSLRDKDGNGIFTEKYRFDETYLVPDWAIPKVSSR